MKNGMNTGPTSTAIAVAIHPKAITARSTDLAPVMHSSTRTYRMIARRSRSDGCSIERYTSLRRVFDLLDLGGLQSLGEDVGLVGDEVGEADAEARDRVGVVGDHRVAEGDGHEQTGEATDRKGPARPRPPRARPSPRTRRSGSPRTRGTGGGRGSRTGRQWVVSRSMMDWATTEKALSGFIGKTPLRNGEAEDDVGGARGEALDEAGAPAWRTRCAR